MKNETLKLALQEWCDFDDSRLVIAIALGLMDFDTRYQTKAKHVFWSMHPIGTMLQDFLARLVEEGVLEQRIIDDEAQYRWNPHYRGTWE